MSKNVNIINNAGKDVVVTVNSKDGNTQIVIDLAGNKVELSALEPGQVFRNNNIEYIVLEQLCDNAAAVIRKDCLDSTMEFDFVNNNWKTSSLRKFLNDDYLKELIKDFGEENIISHSVDLLSLDGLDDYGTSTDKVSLLTIDMYRKYRKVLGENMDNWWWLLTPNSTPSGCGAAFVQCVRSVGDTNFSAVAGMAGVFARFLSSNLLSLHLATKLASSQYNRHGRKPCRWQAIND